MVISHITYKELLEIISWGLLSMPIKGTSIYDKKGKIKEYKDMNISNAEYKGVYTGSPGRDIYLMLPYLNKDQMKEVSYKLSEKFLTDPPNNHVNIAACIRFIYGQFEKNGILRSKEDFKRMKKEKPNWSLSRKFLKLLYKEFEKNNNFYGLTILCEMEGHRLGDEAVINKDKDKLKEMEEIYEKSVQFAYKCKSYKHMFTPYYWCAMYFSKFKNVKKALYYYKLTIEQADKYCPDSRESYVHKLCRAVSYIKSKDEKNWNSFYKKYKNNSKNACVIKLFKRLGKFIKRLRD